MFSEKCRKQKAFLSSISKRKAVFFMSKFCHDNRTVESSMNKKLTQFISKMI